MSEDFLPIQCDLFVKVDEEKKKLSGQINIYKKNENGRYDFLGSSSQNREIDDNFKPNTYYVKKEDEHLLIGGNKTKRRQYRYRSSSKKRVASRRRNVSRHRRGRQTRYSRRK
jgi:hypothetical protein